MQQRYASRIPILLLAACLAFACLAGRAAGAAEQRVALVIGNQAYQNAPVLANAVQDGRSMADAFRSRGFDVVSGFDVDRRRMNRLIDEFVGRLSSNTIAIVYYAGHGVQLRGANYLLPTDISVEREEDIANDGVELGRLMERMSDVNKSFNLAILDACRNNPFAQSGRAIGGSRGLAPTPANGVMIVYSAGANQTALDKLSPADRDPNGLFTRELLKVMTEPGLPIREAISHLRVQVSKEASSVGHQQVPAVYDEVIGDFSFTPNGSGVAPRPAPEPAVAALPADPGPGISRVAPVAEPPRPAPAPAPPPAPPPAASVGPGKAPPPALPAPPRPPEPQRLATLPTPPPPPPAPPTGTAPPQPIPPQNFANELTNFGIPAQPFLQPNVGTATPTMLPGGGVVTTVQVRQALGTGPLLIDVWDERNHPTIPGAIRLPGAGNPGTLGDPTTQRLWTALSQLTQQRRDRQIAFFCKGAYCWESYNAALRAIHLGFTAVYWYRGGMDSWHAAGLPVGPGTPSAAFR